MSKQEQEDFSFYVSLGVLIIGAIIGYFNKQVYLESYSTTITVVCMIVGAIATLIIWKLFWKFLFKLLGGIWYKIFPAQEEDSHGSATWGDDKIAARFLGFDKPGFTLGKMPQKKKQIPFRVLSHIVSCAPTRSGKGIGAIIPALLEYPGSIICLDIKGENYAVTNRQREALGSRPFLVDPFGITGGRKSRFNWLDFIDVNSPDCVSQATALADLIVVPSKGGADHFDDSARNLLQGLLLLVASDPDKSARNMGALRNIITLQESKFLAIMEGNSDSTEAYGIIGRCCAKIAGTPDKERGSIISTAQRHTAFLDDPRIAETLSGSDFDLSKIKEQNMTIYIVLPPDKLRAYRGFARGFFGLALSAITMNQIVPKNKVLFLMDEFGQLGKMTQFENAISLLSGMGALFWFFVQDLSQLRGVYDKWQTFLANSTKQFFGCADLDTAKYISDSLGSFTQVVNTGNEETVSYVARKLLTPDEVMGLPAEMPIVFIQGEPPYVLRRLAYFQEPEYEGLYDANPYFNG